MDRSKIVEGIKKAKENSKKRNFTQSIDITISLKEIDLNNPKNRINEELVLPHGKGKPVKIGVIADGDLAMKARDFTDMVITKEKLKELQKNRRLCKEIAKKYDFFIAQADMMPMVGKILGPVLGPRGKMAKPIPPTADLKPLFDRYSRTVRIKMKDQPVISVPVGTEEMDDDKISENCEAVISAIERKLEKGSHHIKNIFIKTTMGAPIKVK
ncbi:MAG: 50S ribosomal protein L1 [Candidatus Hydrothermarchaeota archaeon]